MPNSPLLKDPPRRAAQVAVRPLVDALLQSSTVELFQSRGIAVAPSPSSVGNPHHAAYFDLAGVVALSSPKASGSISLSWGSSVFSLFTPPVPPATRAAHDLLRELTNQLAGRVKNRLLNFALVLNIGLPNVLSGPSFDQQRRNRDSEVVYSFRTLRGDIVVTLDLRIDADALTYSSMRRSHTEGDFIAF